MFTGIVERTGTVERTESADGGRRMRIGCGAMAEELAGGQSVAVDGACLTVEDRGGEGGGGWFEAFLSEETVARTALGDREEGDAVNLERAMRADARLDGHFVQGHVDGVTRIEAVEEVGDGWTVTYGLPEEWSRYVVEKGSIALDGVSLTVAALREDSFDVAVIPETMERTSLSERDVGDAVNLEVDVIAKYVERLVGGYVETDGGTKER
jgi:riboflavin synthase